MDNLHKRISKNNSWYRNWHDTDIHSLVHWLIFLIVVVLCWFALNGQIYLWLAQINSQDIVVSLPTSQAVISLEPKTNTIRAGTVFSTDIILNTEGGPIDGVDIYTLHYDPSILQVIDDSPSQKGVQIQPGRILPISAVNIVNESTGTIKLGQASIGGTSFTGRGVLATIHFKAIGIGTSYLKFDFNRGSTVDTNAAHRGKDKLASVVDAIYTIIQN